MKLISEMNTLPQITPEPKSRAAMYMPILQNTVIKLADGGHFEFWVLRISANIFGRVTPLNFSLAFIEDKSTEKSSFALLHAGHGSAPDDQTNAINVHV